MSQKPKALVTLTENPGSIPATAEPLTSACNSSSRGPYSIFWPPQVLQAHTHVHTYMSGKTLGHIKIINN